MNVVRPVSSMPATHRQSTLSAISSKAHALSSQIVHVRAAGQKMQQTFQQTGSSALSRLQQAHQIVNKL